MNGRAERNVPADPKPSQSARTIQQDLWLIAVIFVLATVIAGRVWSLCGWLAPIHVSSGSMADS
ncbi:MAG: hypothetical protein KDA59_07510, partial [Planctomycetales bacterium]|nr:hypothetical protein [Planctomycetales bacterium]